MKILMVNKFFYIKGGSETYYFALKRKLEKEGHIVIDFSMKDKKNFESKWCGAGQHFGPHCTAVVPEKQDCGAGL